MYPTTLSNLKHLLITSVKGKQGCSSAGKAGRLVIRRSLVQIPVLDCMLKCPWARYWTPPCDELETHPRPETRLGLAPAATPHNPMERDKRFRQWHDVTWHDTSHWQDGGEWRKQRELSKNVLFSKLCTQTMFSVVVFMCRDPGDTTSKVSAFLLF